MRPFVDALFAAERPPLPPPSRSRAQSGIDKRQVSHALPGGCHKGQLTTLGQLQARALGTWIRTRYVSQARLLPPAWVVGDVAVRTTNLSRTLATAAGVLSGLYPDLAHASSVPVEATTVSDEVEWLYPNAAACPRLKVSA